jgi:HSP20 family molecular chaperone IbpA
MSLMRFSPSNELEEFPVGLRLFQDSVSRLFSEPSNRPWSPAVDIFETEHDLVRIERGYGSFVRAFTLPDSVDVDKVKAEYKSGVLTVTLAKKEVAKPKTIRVEINNN